MKSRLTLIQTVVVCFVLCSLALGQDLASFEKRTTVKKLSNGLTIVICERPEAPVFSFFTHVDAGSVQDPMDKTAHLAAQPQRGAAQILGVVLGVAHGGGEQRLVGERWLAVRAGRVDGDLVGAERERRANEPAQGVGVP